MDIATIIQTLDETVFISLHIITTWKGMNPIILPPGLGK